MSTQTRRTLWAICLLLACYASPSAAQKLDVKIIDRQNNGGTYTYVVPGFASSTLNTNVACNGSVAGVNCNSATTTTGSNLPALVGSYEVHGATLSLQLPDGRVAVVNCSSKTNWTDWSQGVYRSCRVPLVNSIHAEFSGDKAKLTWSVSIDGRKMESETYKILGVLDKP